MMNPKNLAICFTTASLLVTAADAATYRYRQSGDWSTIYNGVGSGWALNDGTQSGDLPDSNDDARINFGGNTVTVTSTVPTVSRVQIGVDESGNVVVANNGVLGTTGNFFVGNNNSNATGTLTVQSGGTVNVGAILYTSKTSSFGNLTVQSGGDITVANHLFWGVTQPSTVTIGGTLTQTGGILGLGTEDAVNASGGTATVNILGGGLLELFNISSAAGLPSIQTGSSINLLQGATMTLPGDRIGTVQQYIDANKIAASGGTFSLSYESGANLTTLTVVPEPSTLGLFGAACALGLFSRRRR